MRVITSNGEGVFLERDAIDFTSGEGPLGPAITIGEQPGQPMLGFGAALTDAACWMLNQLREDRRDALLREVFAPDGMNYSLARVCVGASDYARVPYCHDDVPGDVELKHFSLDYDRQYILPLLRQARAINPDLFLYSSPWSPPGWMKTSGAMQGGWMLQKYIEPYARYYLKFLEGYRAEGVTLNGLTTQNEAETDQISRMPACLWHPDFEAEFVRTLRPLLTAAGFEDMKIWLMDHNWVMWNRVLYLLGDPATAAAVDGVAWHPYEGVPQMGAWVKEAHPDKEMHWTEGGVGLGTADYRTDFPHWAKTFIEAIRAGCQSITAWNLALDQNGYPNVGHFNCAGTVTINRDTLEITRSGQFYALGHFSRFVQRGARYLPSDGHLLPDYYSHAAFRNPDGSHVLVIGNSLNENHWLTVECGDRRARVWVLRNSITTLTW